MMQNIPGLQTRYTSFEQEAMCVEAFRHPFKSLKHVSATCPLFDSSLSVSGNVLNRIRR